MRRDVKIMSTYNLMDYSLLMGIQENPEFTEVMKEMRNSSGDMSVSVKSGRNSSITSNSMEMVMIRERFIGNRHKYLSSCGRYIYHIGIIDYLQDYNIDKKLENLLKYRILMKGSGISAVPPPDYADRFLRFMRDHVIIDQK